MNNRRLPALLLLVAAGMSFSLGVRAAPRNSAYIVLGVVFFVLGMAALRRSRPPGS